MKVDPQLPPPCGAGGGSRVGVFQPARRLGRPPPRRRKQEGSCAASASFPRGRPMTANKPDTESTWIDPDDAPELTDEWFQKADLYDGEKLIRRGRRPLENPKKAISLRVDADVLEKFKSSGPGWYLKYIR